MTEKERLYKLYEAEFLVITDIQTNSKSLKVIRVPGGWIINDIFVPFDNEKQKYAYEPSKEIIKIRCNAKRDLPPWSCNFNFDVRKKEDFQKQIYECPRCASTIDLNYLVKRKLINPKSGEDIFVYKDKEILDLNHFKEKANKEKENE